jgi:hypothetical protein
MKIFGMQIRAPGILSRGIERKVGDVVDRRLPAEARDTFEQADPLDGVAWSPRRKPKTPASPLERWGDSFHDIDRKRTRSGWLVGAALPAVSWPLAVATPGMVRRAIRPELRYDPAEFHSALDPNHGWGGSQTRNLDPQRFWFLAATV